MTSDPFSGLGEKVMEPFAREPRHISEDPFLTLPSQIVPAPQMVTAGRYRLPNRDGSAHKGGWTRATNLASAISDTKALGDWECRMVLLGVREALWQAEAVTGEPIPGLPDSLHALMSMDIDNMQPGQIRSELMTLVSVFKALAKAELGAQRGNLAHQMVEHHHAGIPQAAGVPLETLEKLPSYVERLQVHKLQALPGMQERQVMVESLNVVGTLDNILRDLLQTVGVADKIADLKTQKRFWSWLEIACQLALYAHGDAMWDPVQARWVDMPPVNREEALVAWMPWEHPTENPQVDIYAVDIVKGWKAVQVAHEVYGLRSAAKRKGEPWGWLRPVPRIGLVEAYGARLRDVSTRAEASRVYAEASEAGAWGEELEQVAREILPRLA